MHFTEGIVSHISRALIYFPPFPPYLHINWQTIQTKHTFLPTKLLQKAKEPMGGQKWKERQDNRGAPFFKTVLCFKGPGGEQWKRRDESNKKCGIPQREKMEESLMLSSIPSVLSSICKNIFIMKVCFILRKETPKKKRMPSWLLCIVYVHWASALENHYSRPAFFCIRPLLLGLIFAWSFAPLFGDLLLLITCSSPEKQKQKHGSRWSTASSSSDMFRGEYCPPSQLFESWTEPSTPKLQQKAINSAHNILSATLPPPGHV